MKIYCLIGTGRSGVDFFQTLFDKHPEVSQLPGVFYYDLFLEKIKKKKKKYIASKFINEHERFFNSKIYKEERHDQLGEKKNEYFTVKKNLFIKNFVELCKNPDDNYGIFVNLHLAYSAACGENIKSKKIIILNVHNIEHLKNLNNFNYEIIISIRHPISSLSSSINHWLNFSKKNVDLWWLHYQINRLINLIEDCITLNKKIYILRLDFLHNKNIKYIRKISKIMNISYNSCMEKSTYHGKLWWGDKLSIKYINGFNKNFNDKYDKKLFFKKDIIYLNYFLNFYYTNYKYKKIYSDKFKKIYSFLPLKFELIIWKNLIINLNFLQLFLIPYYWIKRINIMKIKKKK